MSAAKISLAFNTLPFELELADGSTLYAVMTEMSGKSRNEYMDFVDSKVKRDDDGQPVGMKSWKGSQTKILSLCLHRAELEKDGLPVEQGSSFKPGDLIKEAELTTWPDAALQLLSKAAVQLSRLNESPEEAGNG